MGQIQVKFFELHTDVVFLSSCGGNLVHAQISSKSHQRHASQDFITSEIIAKENGSRWLYHLFLRFAIINFNILLLMYKNLIADPTARAWINRSVCVVISQARNKKMRCLLDLTNSTDALKILNGLNKTRDVLEQRQSTVSQSTRI